MIPPGSDQDVEVAVALNRLGEEHPSDFRSLVSTNEPLFNASGSPRGTVFYYSATGFKLTDSFMTHGGFYHPSFSNVVVANGPVKVKYADQYENGNTSIAPINPNSIGALPSGYTLWNGQIGRIEMEKSNPRFISARYETGFAFKGHVKHQSQIISPVYEITTQAVVSGPHIVTFTMPSGVSPEKFSNLRILHLEDNQFVDRTVLPTNIVGSTVSAKVNTLGLFVIALKGNAVPVNQAPIVKTKNITLQANSGCSAFIQPGDIDNGTSDPDFGDTFSLTLSQSSPLRLGDNLVALIATDRLGASSSATALVTLVDNTPPLISNLRVDKTSLFPPNHEMIPIRVDYDLSDNCSQSSALISVMHDENVDGNGDGNTGIDWQVVDWRNVLLRAERSGSGSGRIYSIVVTARDAAGNSTQQIVTVNVPHNK